MRKKYFAQTVLGGDFNYVTVESDRRSSASSDQSGRRDLHEENHWQNVVAAPLNLMDVYQPEMTHASALARSRLDRIYANLHQSDVLDRHLQCAALEWVPDLLAHRAVAFERRSPQHVSHDVCPLSDQAISHDDWPRRVVLEFGTLISNEPSASPIRRLVLYKEATRTAAKNSLRLAA